MSVSDLLVTVALFGACAYLVVDFIKERREQRRIDRYMATLGEWGYAAGKLGYPPTFFETEKPERDFDFVDRLAIGRGWDAGFQEYLKHHQNTSH